MAQIIPNLQALRMVPGQKGRAQTYQYYISLDQADNNWRTVVSIWHQRACPSSYHLHFTPCSSVDRSDALKFALLFIVGSYRLIFGSYRQKPHKENTA
ncbi:MAG TPA: hypothetical protein VIB00_05785 [Pyrinomonadaceae bacterium]